MSAWPDIDINPGLHEAALHVYRYARRWAVGMSDDPSEAVVYDACIHIINNEIGLQPLGPSRGNSAVHDRYQKFGPEKFVGEFSLPVDPSDAVVLLHRFARRYTNGRGTYTAALVNAAARQLLDLGVSLDSTRQVDGTIWAADGADGEYDDLSEAERAEAFSVLRRRREPPAQES